MRTDLFPLAVGSTAVDMGKLDGPVIQAVDRRGRAVPVAVRRVSRVDAFDAFEIRSTIAAPNRLTLHLDYPWSLHGPPARLTSTYEVVRSWKRPSLDAVTIARAKTEAFRWTCSRQHSRNLTPSSVASAYRVVWATSAKDFRDGKVDSLVLPRNMSLFFVHGRPAPAEALLELGYSSCKGRTFDFKGRAVWVGLQAMFADGRKTKPPPPRRLSPPG